MLARLKSRSQLDEVQNFWHFSSASIAAFGNHQGLFLPTSPCPKGRVWQGERKDNRRQQANWQHLCHKNANAIVTF